MFVLLVIVVVLLTWIQLDAAGVFFVPWRVRVPGTWYGLTWDQNASAGRARRGGGGGESVGLIFPIDEPLKHDPDLEQPAVASKFVALELTSKLEGEILGFSTSDTSQRLPAHLEARGVFTMSND